MAATNCLFYFTHLNDEGMPIPGTMFAKQSNNKIDPGYKCLEARLSPYQMTAPAGQSQCFPENGLRYFYRVDSRTHQVVPNSLWSQVGKPSQMCQGTVSILEYKIFR